jgi:alkylhydroperoxidase/carboxymuconolactone decarboxylase family protein YurZ
MSRGKESNMDEDTVKGRIDKLEEELQEEFPRKIKAVANLAPDMFRGYTKMREMILQDGELSRKSKLLIALGILTALRAEETLKLYAQITLNAGASREELSEAMSVGVIFSGGPGIVAISDAFQGLNLE